MVNQKSLSVGPEGQVLLSMTSPALFLLALLALPSESLSFAPGFSCPGDLGGVRMVGEEGVGGQRAVRATSGSLTHPPHKRLGLGTERQGSCVTLLHPLNPGASPSPSWPDWMGVGSCSLYISAGPPKPLGCQGRQPIGVDMALSVRRRGSWWN